MISPRTIDRIGAETALGATLIVIALAVLALI
jgi:hypothetical protein